MIRSILIHPDPRLKKVCAPVANIGDDVRALMDDMLQTMYDAPGIGLAAPQLGVLSRVIVMDCAKGEDEEPEPICLANPEVILASDELREHEEGCLSIPEIYAMVTRPASVRVRYVDREGTEQERDFEGIRSTCVQHEIDHLNGKLFIDYLGSMRRQMITSKMKKLKRERSRIRAEAG
ncbi:MAG: peptide deformylase [Paracoccaceae bacterium]|nr:peptide deformylase [Paracoccaceae bacterium]